jgi:hypothetical protein
MSKDLRNKIIRLAHQKPELRKHLLPLLTKQAGYPKAPKIKSKDEAKAIEETKWQDWSPVQLPDEPSKYFLNDKNLVKVPVKDLKPIRAREKGISNANKFMWLAYNGFKPKRKPISLKREKDGSYTILDGNSTFANAKENGWKIMWGVLEEDEYSGSGDKK